jgi:type IV secretory pathway VirB3-like protein
LIIPFAFLSIPMTRARFMRNAINPFAFLMVMTAVFSWFSIVAIGEQNRMMFSEIRQDGSCRERPWWKGKSVRGEKSPQ